MDVYFFCLTCRTERLEKMLQHVHGIIFQMKFFGTSAYICQTVFLLDRLRVVVGTSKSISYATPLIYFISTFEIQAMLLRSSIITLRKFVFNFIHSFVRTIPETSRVLFESTCTEGDNFSKVTPRPKRLLRIMTARKKLGH